MTRFGTLSGQSVNLVDKPQLAVLGESLRSDTMDEYAETLGSDHVP